LTVRIPVDLLNFREIAESASKQVADAIYDAAPDT